MAARWAGFRGLDLVNLAVTTNARGGPEIVLASVAYGAGIISPKFYTALAIAAVLTSQFAGAWPIWRPKARQPSELRLPAFRQ